MSDPVKVTRSGSPVPESVRVTLDDRTMDRIIDDLSERAGLGRGTDALGLARWDLKAVLQKHGWGHDSEGRRR